MLIASAEPFGHPPLQCIAQGAIMAIEDGWVLAEHVKRNMPIDGRIDWDAALAAYNAVRPEHCRRILTTGQEWGEPWHLRDRTGYAETR